MSGQRPILDDTIWIARKPDGSIVEAFRRRGQGDIVDISGDVGSVDVTRESFHIVGRSDVPHIEPWRVSCDRDPESTDTMLRGTVRLVLLDWHSQCRERIAANMERFGLTDSQQQLCWLIFGGLTNPEMAEELSISHQGVKNRVSALMHKLGQPYDNHYAVRQKVILRLLDCEGLT